MGDFIKTRGVSLWLTLLGMISGVAAYFLYAKYGITEFSPSLSGSAVIALWVGAGLCLLGAIINLKPVKFLAYLAYLYAFFGFIGSQVTYIANIFVSIDGTTFSTGFIMTTVAFVAAMVLALIAAIISKEAAGEARNG